VFPDCFAKNGDLPVEGRGTKRDKNSDSSTIKFEWKRADVDVDSGDERHKSDREDDDVEEEAHEEEIADEYNAALYEDLETGEDMDSGGSDYDG
jgi:hypothetical protein